MLSCCWLAAAVYQYWLFARATLLARFDNSRQLAFNRQLSERDPAQAEVAHVSSRTAGYFTSIDTSGRDAVVIGRAWHLQPAAALE